MNFFGGKKETPQEATRKQVRELSKAQRIVQRSNNDLDKEEKKLEAQIKQLAKQGQKQACAMLAKQLVAIRKQKTRNISANSRIGAIGSQAKMMNANTILSGAMAASTDVLKATNKQMDASKVAEMLKQFEQESMKMEMTDEMIDESLSGILDNSEDEAEEDAVVNKILDELAIDVNQQLSKVKTPSNDLEEIIKSIEKKKTHTFG